MYILPFVVVLVLLGVVEKASHESLEAPKSSCKIYCIIAGIMCAMICGIYEGNISSVQSVSILVESSKEVFVGNISLFATLLLFGSLIEIITESGAIKELSTILNCLINNKVRFLFLLVGCALAASVDDYLACILLTTLMGACYKQLGLQKTDICFFINTVVVAFCSMLPVSTWAPVITEALSSNGGAFTNELTYLRYCFNYFVYFSIIAVLVILITKKINESAVNRSCEKTKRPCNRLPILLMCICIILYGTYILARNCQIMLISNNPLLVSCISALVFCHFAFKKKIQKKKRHIYRIYVDGAKSMWDLVKFLYVLWIYTECLERMLHINETILQQVMDFHIPLNILPFVVFGFSGFISYCTGSVFATVRLLVPISLALGMGLGVEPVSLCIIAGAAINGSLLASVSPLSDTMAICCNKMEQDEKIMYKAHLPYTVGVILGAGYSYLLAGYFINKGLLLATIGPILIVCPMMVSYILAIPMVHLIFTLRKKRLAYLLSKYKSEKSQSVFWRYAKPRFKNIYRITCKKYFSSKPIRNRPVYKLKLC